MSGSLQENQNDLLPQIVLENDLEQLKENLNSIRDDYFHQIEQQNYLQEIEKLKQETDKQNETIQDLQLEKDKLEIELEKEKTIQEIDKQNEQSRINDVLLQLELMQQDDYEPQVSLSLSQQKELQKLSNDLKQFESQLVQKNTDLEYSQKQFNDYKQIRLEQLIQKMKEDDQEFNKYNYNDNKEKLKYSNQQKFEKIQETRNQIIQESKEILELKKQYEEETKKQNALQLQKNQVKQNFCILI